VRDPGASHSERRSFSASTPPSIFSHPIADKTSSIILLERSHEGLIESAPGHYSKPSGIFLNDSWFNKSNGGLKMIYKNCQSCGMPLSKDAQGGGTESNGARSSMYCSHCYQDGKFTQPDMTVDQMKSLVKGKMKEMRIPGLMSYFLTMGLPRLKRWAANTKG
jgi:hypothetical protein